MKQADVTNQPQHHHPGSQHMSAKKKTKKWLINIDEVDEAIDEAMDGRKITGRRRAICSPFIRTPLSTWTGGPKRLLGMLRRLEATHTNGKKSTKTRAALNGADNRRSASH
jgi:hypothetical protein